MEEKERHTSRERKEEEVGGRNVPSAPLSSLLFCFSCDDVMAFGAEGREREKVDVIDGIRAERNLVPMKSYAAVSGRRSHQER